jgi:hypothetical protein
MAERARLREAVANDPLLVVRRVSLPGSSGVGCGRAALMKELSRLSLRERLPLLICRDTAMSPSPRTLSCRQPPGGAGANPATTRSGSG